MTSYTRDGRGGYNNVFLPSDNTVAAAESLLGVRLPAIPPALPALSAERRGIVEVPVLILTLTGGNATVASFRLGEAEALFSSDFREIQPRGGNGGGCLLEID